MPSEISEVLATSERCHEHVPHTRRTRTRYFVHASFIMLFGVTGMYICMYFLISVEREAVISINLAPFYFVRSSGVAT